MITTINEFRKIFENNNNLEHLINENLSPEKNDWWDNNYAALINYANNAEDLENLLLNNGLEQDEVDAELDGTGKHIALTLLHLLEINELNELLQEEDEY